MTEAEALEIVREHKGRIESDYKALEWSDEAKREVVFIVTLWLPPKFTTGMEGGGDTLVDATKMALDGIESLKKKEQADEGR